MYCESLTPDRWQSRREALNHQWLANDFLRRLGAFNKRLRDTNPNNEKLDEFLTEQWQDWGNRYSVMKTLLHTAEEALSPSHLFSRPPLSNMGAEEKAWLIGLVHKNWLVRTDIRKLVSNAMTALEDSNTHYTKINELLSENCNSKARIAQNNEEAFLEFESDIRNLSKSISKLPHKIQVL